MTVSQLLDLKGKYKKMANYFENDEAQGCTEEELDAMFNMARLGLYGRSEPSIEIDRFFLVIELLLRAEDKVQSTAKEERNG